MILYEYFHRGEENEIKWFRSKRAASRYMNQQRRLDRQHHEANNFFGVWYPTDSIYKHQFKTNKDGLIEFLNHFCRSVN